MCSTLFSDFSSVDNTFLLIPLQEKEWSYSQATGSTDKIIIMVIYSKTMVIYSNNGDIF